MWFGQAHLYSMWYHHFFYASGIFLGKLEKYHIRFLTLQLVGLLFLHICITYLIIPYKLDRDTTARREATGGAVFVVSKYGNQLIMHFNPT